MINYETLTLNAALLPAFIVAILFAISVAIGALIFHKQTQKAESILLPVILLPGLLTLMTYIFNGFDSLDWPIVHWLFRKDLPESLHIGFILDPLAALSSLVMGVLLLSVVIRNRPRTAIISAMGLCWAAFSIVATAKTFWVAAIGLGIGSFTQIVPILFSVEEKSENKNNDLRWAVCAKRTWIGLLISTVGASGLAATGTHLDFFNENNLVEAMKNPTGLIAVILLFVGVLISFLPMSSSIFLHEKRSGFYEEEVIIGEGLGGWSALIVLYRLYPNIHDTVLGFGLEWAALLILMGSCVVLAFLESKRSAIYFWLTNTPLMVLLVFPSISSGNALLLIIGSFIAYCGLIIAFDHDRKATDQSAAGFFFLGSLGFIGWSTSGGIVEFFSLIEERPALCIGAIIIWIIFSAFGFRILLRGGETANARNSPAKWITLGLFALLGLAPVLSGRWSGGAIPDVSDWLDQAKNWPWVSGLVTETAKINWAGFGSIHAAILIGGLLGAFISRQSELFPFSKSYPRAGIAARGVFGLVFISKKWAAFLIKPGKFLEEKVFLKVWEKIIPSIVLTGFNQLKFAGEKANTATDRVTSNQYAYFLSAPSKVVQWFHGGNVRLYAWFAIGWVLILSIYLAR